MTDNPYAKYTNTDSSNPYSKYTKANQPTEEKSEKASTLTSGVKGFLAGLVPSAGAMAGAGAGFELGTIGGPVGAVVGAVVGGIGGGMAGSAAQEAALPEDVKQDLAKSAKEHPYASMAGEIASGLPTMGVGAASKVARVAMGGLGGAGEAVKEKLGGEDLDPTKIAMATAGGAAMASPTKLGSKIAPGFERGSAKLAQTAIKNKSTGEVEPMGPKHDEARKTETKDTHQQGFLDEQGNFLDRKEAHQRAVETGQVPPDQKLERPEEGLHSGDLRSAGEEQFKTAKDKFFDHQDKKSAEYYTPETGEQPAVPSYHEGKSPEQVVVDSMNNLRASVYRADMYSQRVETSMTNATHRQLATKFLDRGIDVGKFPDKEAIPIIEDVRNRFKRIGEDAVRVGVLDSLRDNYITHMLDFRESGMSEQQQKAFMDKFFGQPKDSKLVKDFAEQRHYEFIEDLESAIKGTGVIVQKDVAKIINAYEKSMTSAIIHKKMTDHYKSQKTTDGHPLIVATSNKALQDGYVPFQGKGAKALGDVLVHPALVDTLGHMYRQTDPGLLMNTLLGVNHLTKSMNTIGSFFHAYSLGTAHLMSDPANAVKELFTGGAGIRRAVNAFKHGADPEYEKDIHGFLDAGLMAETEDIKRTIIADAGRATDEVLNKAGLTGPLIQRITEPLDKHILQRMNSFTWDYMHTGQKLNLAMVMLGKMKAKNPGMTEEQIHQSRIEISRHINNTFGGLNWADVANQSTNHVVKTLANKMSNIQGRDYAQLLLFAPDWTVSTLRAFTTAIPKTVFQPKNWELRDGIKGIYNPKTQGDFARKYVLHTTLAYFTIINGINMATSGHPVWENKDATRVDLGDGTSMQAAKHSMEFAEWTLHPEKTLGNKLGFLPKSAVVSTTGIQYPSPDAPKLKDNTLTGRIEAILTMALPFQVGSAVQAPEGQGLGRAAWSTGGLPIYGQTDKEHTDPDVWRKRQAEAQAKRRETIKKRKEEARRHIYGE